VLMKFKGPTSASPLVICSILVPVVIAQFSGPVSVMSFVITQCSGPDSFFFFDSAVWEATI